MENHSLIPKLPSRISRLGELAYNLWWSWHPQARKLFRSLDYPLCRLSDHNPVKQIIEIDPSKLQAAAVAPTFLALYDSVISDFDADMSNKSNRVSATLPALRKQSIAYFSAEFAIHHSLPIYAGGLGVLAGDFCKEASDLALPLVSVGFMYPQGYFNQHISAEGWQEEIPHQLDFSELPITRVLSNQGKTALSQVQLCDSVVSIAAWLVRIGAVNLYLLDTNIEENNSQDRQLSARLYTAEQEERFKQEIVLGIGGVRALRALRIKPVIWHANEGHVAFMMLERIREEVVNGIDFAKAIRRVQASTVFTTHTTVPAGNDIFPSWLIDKYLHNYWDSIGIDLETFLSLGRCDDSRDQSFNMTAFALRTADQRNAVSRLHEKVTRKIWHRLWPDVPEEQVPIIHVTNGIHVPTWVAPELGRLYGKYLGQDWIKRHDDPELWEKVLDIPDNELWGVLQLLKRKLISEIMELAQQRWAEGRAGAQQILAMGALLDAKTLTIGFCRRFAEYKRPGLILSDIERLKRIVNNQLHPVQIIFAGKSHPADSPGKNLLHQVYSKATDHAFRGRIAFIEDYDMHMAHYLVHGVDVWLNTPRRLQEASGTSGMKASLNGVPHLSILDGWWHEGYNGANGWVIGDDKETPDSATEDKIDAESLYRLLEEKVVPLYYERDRAGVPRGWIRIVKEAITSVVPIFCTRRMMKEYTEQIYMPTLKSLKNRKMT